jgi:hypothetical protein
MQNMNGTLSPIWVEDSGDGLDVHETTDSKVPPPPPSSFFLLIM